MQGIFLFRKKKKKKKKEKKKNKRKNIIKIMSSDLIWSIVRKNNAFLVKSNGKTLSKEANNVTNENSYKFSGLANTKTVSVNVVNKTKGKYTASKVVATVSNGKKTQRISNTHSYGLRSKVNKQSQSDNVIDTLTSKSYFRADLNKYAKKRANALHKSLRTSTTATNSKKRRRRN